MATYAITDTQLINIADSIRRRAGTQDTLEVDEMPTAISNIPGGSVTESITYSYTLEQDYTSTSNTTLVDNIEAISDFVAKYFKADDFVIGARLVFEQKAENTIAGNIFTKAKSVVTYCHFNNSLKRYNSNACYISETGTYGDYGDYGLRFFFDKNTRYKNSIKASLQARCASAGLTLLKAGEYTLTLTVLKTDNIND